MDWDERRDLDKGGTVVAQLIHHLTISFKCCILFVMNVHAKLLTQALKLLEADASQSTTGHDHVILIIIMRNYALN